MSAIEDPLPLRVLPALDDENRFFWTAGADGVLRFLRCQACGHWIHPPAPVCPRCLGRSVAPEAVSGLGELLSFTVNHQPWIPDSPPYVLVLVELDEQEGLRLTSNLVDYHADDLRVASRVEVVFVERDHVWLPLFKPSAR
jgi:uncharacterized OB-fold protein